jgi:hypothetical protein
MLGATADDDAQSLSWLEAALVALPPTHESDVRRRLRICALCHDLWTSEGADDAGAAPYWFNGAVDALQAYAADADELQPTPKPAVRRFACTPSLELFTQFCLANAPCVFPVDTSESLWQHCCAWVADGKPDVQQLAASFPAGSSIIATTASRERVRMTLSEFAQHWKQHDLGAAVSPADAQLYLKDLPFGGLLYRGDDGPPSLFADDWLGGCHDAQRASAEAPEAVSAPDLRFVYCGPAGSATPLHSDIWQTHSWSVNVCGVKRWRFIAPADAHLLLDWLGRRLAPTTDGPERASPLFPRLQAARVVEVLQAPGEAIFVPSGWVHSVENVTACLSVNCNWANASNIHGLLAHARAESAAVESLAKPLLQGPPLTPLLFEFVRFAAERELAQLPPHGAADRLPRLLCALTLSRAEQLLRSWPELAPGDACALLADRCRAARSQLGH